MIKKLKVRGQFPHSKDKSSGTVLCQTTLYVIYLVSVNIYLIKKVLRNFK